MICQTCGRETSPSEANCRVCNTPPGAPAVWPGRTYALRGLGIAASIAVALVVLLELASVLWPMVGRVMAERALRADDPQLLLLGAASELVVALPLVLAYVAAAVLVIIWLYRARVNLDLFPGAGPTMAAGWAIGGWFVPFVSFVVPCRVMANIARDSLWRSRTPVLVGIWWAAWLVSQCGGNWFTLSEREAANALPSTISGPADYQAYIDYYSDTLVRGLPATAATVVAGVALIMLIRQISNAQQARIARANPAGPILPGATLVPPVLPALPTQPVPPAPPALPTQPAPAAPPAPRTQSEAGGTSPIPPEGGGGTIGA